MADDKATSTVLVNIQQEVQDEFNRRIALQNLKPNFLNQLFCKLSWLFLVKFPAWAKRAIDIGLAMAMLLMLAPIMLIISLALWLVQRQVFAIMPCMGRWCKVFNKFNFAFPENGIFQILKRARFDHLPLLFNIIRGDLSFVGPRAMAPDYFDLTDSFVRRRFRVRPGLVCLWWLRNRINIAYTSEIEVDCEYVVRQSLWLDLWVMVRAMLVFFYGGAPKKTQSQLTFWDLTIQNYSISEAIDTIISRLNANNPSRICFINANCINVANQDAEYEEILKNTDLNFADGIGMRIAGKILNQEIKQNVNGTDLFPFLCKSMSETKKGIFLLGAKPGVAKELSHWINHNYPEVIISGYHHGYFTEEENEDVVNMVARSGCSVLLVALGTPRQDKWIRDNFEKTGATIVMGVGGLFDFYSGRIPRAPIWVRELGCEWLYRLFKEPARLWHRYLVGNLVFMVRVIKTRFFAVR